MSFGRESEVVIAGIEPTGANVATVSELTFSEYKRLGMPVEEARDRALGTRAVLNQGVDIRDNAWSYMGAFQDGHLVAVSEVAQFTSVNMLPFARNDAERRRLERRAARDKPLMGAPLALRRLMIADEVTAAVRIDALNGLLTEVTDSTLAGPSWYRIAPEIRASSYDTDPARGALVQHGFVKSAFSAITVSGTTKMQDLYIRRPSRADQHATETSHNLPIGYT